MSQMMADAFRRNRCPCCGMQGRLLRGPRGGCSINVLCGGCGTRYNVALLRDRLLADVEIVTTGPRDVPPMERKFFKDPFYGTELI
jgi:hypothetical protein